MSAQRVIGLVLVGLGVFLLLVTQTTIGGEATPLFIGVAFFVVYASTREYGLLIPAGILTGLGTGIVVAAQGGPGPSVVLGLGLGFLSITVIDRLVHGRRVAQWLPLIPGGILAAVGLLALVADTDAGPYIVPVLLVAAGVALLLGWPKKGDDRRSAQEQTQP